MGDGAEAGGARRSSRRLQTRGLANHGSAASCSEADVVEETEHLEPRRSGRDKKLRYDSLATSDLARGAVEDQSEEDDNSSGEETADESGVRSGDEEQGDFLTESSESSDEEERSGPYGLRRRRKTRTAGVEGRKRGRDDEYDNRQQRKRSRRIRKTTQWYSPPPESVPQLARSDSRSIGGDPFRDPPRRSRGHRGDKRSRRLPRHGNSTTENEWSDPDASYFEARRVRSEGNARSRIRPMNLSGPSADLFADRMRSAPKTVDVEPMHIDKSITFEHIGGLDHHISALKEMIVFPILYPDFFESLKVDPPRGVLFYGPPGTGKTLCARALANECSRHGKHVSFFMRKGADCVSKWIGESERMLRLLFDQAYRMRPSIIFFDEIDGLAPVRSSRMDQNYSSIVSTLLAMMDGLDSRGDVVVIGATNRIDQIDPALRRPGRFDREFVFPLPSRGAREKILQIRTKSWRPRPSADLLTSLANQCEGFCGADLKALCAEAALIALSRTFPEIYDAGKVDIKQGDVVVGTPDFLRALQKITPAQQRSGTCYSKRLGPDIAPLLQRSLDELKKRMEKLMPSAFASRLLPHGQSAREIYIDDCVNRCQTSHFTLGHQPYARPPPHCPALIVTGDSGMGHTEYLCPALLSELEKYPVYAIDLITIHADTGSRSAEEALIQIFKEARRNVPSILYVPNISSFWDNTSESMRSLFILMVGNLKPDAGILLLATCDRSPSDLVGGDNATDAFYSLFKEHFRLSAFADSERASFFAEVIGDAGLPPPAELQRQAETQSGVRTRSRASKRKSKESGPFLPSTQSFESETRILAVDERVELERHERATIRQLTIYLRRVLSQLEHDRKYKEFVELPPKEELPDYYQTIASPIALSTMHDKNDQGGYVTHEEFLADIDLMVDNAKKYNVDLPYPNTTPKSLSQFNKRIRRTAMALHDDAHHLIENAVAEHSDLLRECQAIAESRARRSSISNIVTQDDSMSVIEDCVVSNTQDGHHDVSITGEDEIKVAASANGSLAENSVDMVNPEIPLPPPREVENTENLDKLLPLILESTQNRTLFEMLTLRSKLRHAVYDLRDEYDKSLVANRILHELKAFTHEA